MRWRDFISILAAAAIPFSAPSLLRVPVHRVMDARSHCTPEQLRLPLYWDKGRTLAGTSTLWDDFAVSMIALSYAHGDRIPFLSVNTCVHELLHALMQDIFVSRPKWYESDGREFRTDSYTTGLWLFHDGAAIRQSAQACLDRLRSGATMRTPSDSFARP
jgi:hypothetical protein